ADHPGDGPARAERHQAHRGGRRDRHRVGTDRRPGRLLGTRHRTRRRPGGQGRHLRALRPWPRRRGRRGVRPRPLDRARHRHRPRGHPHRRRRAPARRPLHPVPAPRGTAPEGRPAMARILIVEDEARISSFIAKGLQAEGHTTAVAADGVTGLDYALTGDFDLVILDINLPGKDGYEVLEEMRSVGSTLPVIILTARDSVTDTVSAL